MLLKKLLYSIILFTSLTVNSFAGEEVKKLTTKEKRAKLLKLINDEEKTILSISSYKNLGPKLNHRLMNINAERIKIIKEIENENYLSSNIKSKRYFFNESAKLVREINKYATHIYKSYPKYKRIGSVYFIQAIIDRDYSKGKKTLRLLKKSLKRTGPKDPLRYDILSSIAEYYYNQKKYRSAIKYYSFVIKYNKQAWHTKNLYNLSWCYFKVNKFNYAIKFLNQSFNYSQKEQFISFKNEVFNSVSIFYSKANKVKQGMNFFIKHSPTVVKHLVSMAKTNENFGKLADTQHILDYISEQNLNMNESLIYYNYSLSFYRDAKKLDNHQNIVLDIKSFKESFKMKEYTKLKKENKWMEIVEKISDYAGHLQVLFVKNFKYYQRFDQEKLNNLISYFNSLKIIDSDKEYNYSYFIGETYLTIYHYDKSYQHYKNSLNHLLDTNTHNLAFAKNVMNSLYQCMEKMNYYKNNYKKSFYIFEKQLSLWPKSSRSKEVYPRMIYLNLTNRFPKKSEQWLTKYVKNIATDLKNHQSITKDIISYYLKNETVKELNRWITKLQAKYLNLSPKYTKSVINDLSIILFKQTEIAESQKDYTNAISGNISIFENPNYHNSIKAKSSIKLSALYNKIQNPVKSADWANVYIDHSNTENIREFSPVLKTIIDEYILMQDFRSSTKVVKKLYSKYCNLNYKFKYKDKYLDISTDHLLAGGYTENAIKMFKSYKKCIGLKSHVGITQKLTEAVINHHDVKVTGYLINNIKLYKDLKEQLIEHLWNSSVNAAIRGSENLDAYNLLNKHFKNDKRIKQWSDFVKTVSTVNLQKNFHFTSGKFDLTKFQNELELNISLLSKLDTKLQNLYTSSAEISFLALVESYKLNKSFHSTLSNISFTFTDPEIENHVNAQIKGIKKQFSSKVKNMNSKVNSYAVKSNININSINKSNKLQNIKNDNINYSIFNTFILKAGI